jgi:drug/metabolite transporter (DMT)-like permease
MLAPFLFVFLWSSAFIAVRAGMPDVTPLFYLAARFALATAALLLIVTVVRQDWASIRGLWGHLAVAGVLMGALYLSAAYLAMQHINAATMALIGALHPLATAVLARPLLGERLYPIQWLGIGLGIAGVALVVGLEAERPDNAAAALIAVGGVLCLALGTIHYRKHCRDAGLLMANTVQLGAATAVVALLALAFEPVHVTWSPVLVGTLFYLALVVSLGAMALLMFMLRSGTAGKVASNFYLTPGLTAILGWLILGETLAGMAVAGFAVTCVGVWLAQREVRRARR